MPGNILIIDDEEGLRKMLTRIISLESFKVYEAGNLKEAINILSHHSVDVILCDVRLPDGNGLAFIKEIKISYPLVEIILLTAYGNIPDGVQAIKNGAFDYITKGNDNDRLIPLLYQAFEKNVRNRKSSIKVLKTGSYTFKDIIGKSTLLNNARKLAEKIATSDASVLILGETGTGKEVFANAIHNQSKRSEHSFVAINCSAFSNNLLEGELFGYKSGAYTGATKDKKGLFEIADKGTLFLDEIGELNIDLQAKLLRVLENGEFIKLGDVKTTKVDVRILAATNRNLQNEIEAGNFRSDLYYRLNVFSIYLPSLKERPEDIPELIAYFLKYFAQREKKSLIQINKEALKLLEKYSWNGNIRELRNVLERAVVLMDDTVILPKHLPYELQKQDSSSHNLSLAAVEKMHIIKVLEYVKGNKTKAADLLGIGLTTLYRKIEEYSISVIAKI